jgi:hypothetical protein
VPSFHVLPYQIETLIRLFADNTTANLKQVSAKQHCIYFEEYFRSLSAKTIVAEYSYVDLDFLEDYSGYYARCFDDYSRKCLRLHFFQETFSAEQFEKLLSAGDEGFRVSLQNSYLGFIVLKPLPQTVVGRTCLKTYPDDNGRRFFATRVYEANLFGLPLKIETLAFQEQDSESAACATSALWSAFHGTGHRFHHTIPSPLEITKSANALGEHLTRSLPASGGLTTQQMAKAIRSVQLDAYIIGVQNEYLLKSTLYAYLRCLIPVLLFEAIVDISDAAKHRRIDYHAVALTGFSLALPLPVPFDNFLLRASRIDKVYAHDDQLGPFSRMVFDGVKTTVDGAAENSLSTSWRSSGGKEGMIRAVPKHFIIPLYHKIRIPFPDVQDAVMSFDKLIVPLKKSLPSIREPLEWDIYLTTVNELKTAILSGEYPAPKGRRELLLQELPRFLWIATAANDAGPVLTLLFDATDVQQGRFFLGAMEYDAALALLLRAFSKPLATELMNRRHLWRIIQWFADQP